MSSEQHDHEAQDYVVRPLRREDVDGLLALIRLLAVYEKEEDQVKITREQLLKDGFEEPRRYECHVCDLGGELVGYALFFYIYSTWEGLSLYLEDVFVREEHRGRGLGMKLMKSVAKVAEEKGCARMQWQCIDWNTKALEFYHARTGARERTESGGAKWINLILRQEEIKAFARGSNS